MNATLKSGTATDPVVSPAWLWERLQQPNVVVLDATLPPVGVVPAIDTHARYLQRHLPGAVFFDIDALSDQQTTLPHMLPSKEHFSESMAALGVGDEMTIVVYEQEGVFSAPRAWWMLRTLGAAEVLILDGGLRAWEEAGFPVEAGEVERAPAIFHARRNGAAVRSFAEVQSILEDRQSHAAGEQIVDARPGARFSGAAPEPRPGIPSGHMPGAASVPSSTLAQGGRLLSPEAARAVFTQAGLDLSRPVTTTCGSGVTAAILTLQLERCGVSEVRLYDGSWAEYAQQPGARILTEA